MSIRRIEQPAPTAPPLPLLAGDDLSRPLVWRAGQAISAGRFLALPATAEAVYTPDTNGRSDAKAITIRD